MDEHYRLSQEVRDVLATARNEAARAAFTKAQTDHLLMALLIEQTCAKDILATTHVIASMVDGLLAHAPTTMKLKVQDVALGQSTLDLIRRADWHRTKWKHSELLAAHVLAAMLDRSDDDNATRIFRILCTNMDELRRKTEIHLKLLSCPESKPPKPHPEASSEPASTIPAPMHNVVQATPRKTGYKFEDWVTAETATLLANAKEHATKFQAQSVRVEDA
jgi:ATP-dependent Clp protease ATP-binding subunit ClpA